MTGQTLRQYLTEKLQAQPDLMFVIEDIAAACRAIADRVRNSAFEGDTGTTDTVNVQGEQQKPLDLIANDVFEQTCATNPHVTALISEEVDEVTWLKDPKAGDYLLYFDPLDGSSNLDVDLSVGTIFSIIPVTGDGDRNVLHSGTRQICAGYAIYGPSTMFVLTLGEQVDGFTYHSGSGDFILTHPRLSIPADTNEFAINTSRRRLWHPPIQAYIEDCLTGPDGLLKKTYNMRWTASMVADVHRILMRGGVFLYPEDIGNAKTGGKLRLMYEANPMAWLVETAGGAASTGTMCIRDVVPTFPHQRVPVILGSRNEVQLIDSYHAK